MPKVNFSWRIARDIYNRISVLAKAKGITMAAMLNIIVNENISKYE